MIQPDKYVNYDQVTRRCWVLQTVGKTEEQGYFTANLRFHSKLENYYSEIYTVAPGLNTLHMDREQADLMCLAGGNEGVPAIGTVPESPEFEEAMLELSQFSSVFPELIGGDIPFIMADVLTEDRFISDRLSAALEIPLGASKLWFFQRNEQSPCLFLHSVGDYVAPVEALVLSVGHDPVKIMQSEQGVFAASWHPFLKKEAMPVDQDKRHFTLVKSRDAAGGRIIQLHVANGRSGTFTEEGEELFSRKLPHLWGFLNGSGVDNSYLHQVMTLLKPLSLLPVQMPSDQNGTGGVKGRELRSEIACHSADSPERFFFEGGSIQNSGRASEKAVGSEPFRNILSADATLYNICNQKSKNRSKFLEGVVNQIIALLNSDGGRVVVKIPPGCDWQHIGRAIQQHLGTILESSQVHQCIRMTLRSDNSFVIDVDKVKRLSNHFFTKRSFLFFSNGFEVIDVRGSSELLALLQRETVVKGSDEEPGDVKFFLNNTVEFPQSERICECRIFKSEPTKCVTFADRLITNSKLTQYLSAYANSDKGGDIYYGIDPESKTVFGLKLDEVEKEKIKKKVKKLVNGMAWSGGNLPTDFYKLSFCPVYDFGNLSEAKPDLCVLRISVEPMPGAVFAATPESYHCKNGRMEAVSFEQWLKLISRNNLPNVKRVDNAQEDIFAGKSVRRTVLGKPINIDEELGSCKSLTELAGYFALLVPAISDTRIVLMEDVKRLYPHFPSYAFYLLESLKSARKSLILHENKEISCDEMISRLKTAHQIIGDAIHLINRYGHNEVHARKSLLLNVMKIRMAVTQLLMRKTAEKSALVRADEKKSRHQ